MPYIIADTHIQTNDQYHKFIGYVHQLAEDDDVILLGDIFDFTRIPFSDLEYLVDDLDRPHIHYVYGNHDIIAPELGFKCYENLKFDGIEFTHGHQFEALLKSTGFITPDEYASTFERLCYNRNTNGYGAKLSWSLWKILTKFKRSLHSRDLAQSLFELLTKKGNIVIGHTHYEMYSKTRRVLICDDAKFTDIAPDRNVHQSSTRTSQPMGYFLQTETFDMEQFSITSTSNIRSALNAKRNCLHR